MENNHLPITYFDNPSAPLFSPINFDFTASDPTSPNAISTDNITSSFSTNLPKPLLLSPLVDYSSSFESGLVKYFKRFRIHRSLKINLEQKSPSSHWFHPLVQPHKRFDLLF